MTTFYDILGIAPTASADDIKAAYRHLAMQIHPDKTPGANKAVQRLLADKFNEVREAYETLGDAAKRAEYDAALAMLHSEEYYQPPPPPPPPPPRQQQACPKCHKPFPAWAASTDKFCTYCGASLQSPPPPPKDQQQRRPQPPPPPPPPKQQQQPQPLPPLPIGSRVGIAVGVIYGWVVVIALLCGMFEQAHGVTGDIPTPDLCLATIYSTAFFFIIMCRSTHSGLRGRVRKKRAVLIAYLLLAIALTGITMAAIRQKSAPIAAQQQTSRVEARQSPAPEIKQPTDNPVWGNASVKKELPLADYSMSAGSPSPHLHRGDRVLVSKVIGDSQELGSSCDFKTPEGKMGSTWCENLNIDENAIKPPNPPALEKNLDKSISNATIRLNIHMYRNRSLEGETVGQLSENERVTAMKKVECGCYVQGDSLFIRTQNGESGWVYDEYIQTDSGIDCDASGCRQRKVQ